MLRRAPARIRVRARHVAVVVVVAVLATVGVSIANVAVPTVAAPAHAVVAMATDEDQGWTIRGWESAPPTATPPPNPQPPPTAPWHAAAHRPSAPAPPAAALPTGASAAAAAVFQAINQARESAGLRPLASSAGLVRSAHLHNLAMASYDEMVHQCPGEAGLGARVSQQGVRWSWAAENIGESQSLSTSGALGLEGMMINEQPPNDDHRLNILSTTATIVGVDVLFDPVHHRLWLTEDFAN